MLDYSLCGIFIVKVNQNSGFLQMNPHEYVHIEKNLIDNYFGTKLFST